jgi:hypothetical protein
VVEGARVTWVREGFKIFLMYGEKLVSQWEIEDRGEFLFSQMISTSGDFQVTDVEYKWIMGGQIDFRDIRLQRRNGLVWKDEEQNGLGLGKVSLRQKLVGDFDVFLLSRDLSDDDDAQRLRLSSDQVNIEVVFSQLQGGGEATLLKDGSVVSRRNFEHKGSDIYLGVRGEDLIVLANGQELFQDSLGIKGLGWTLTLDPGGPNRKHSWVRAIWRLK